MSLSRRSCLCLAGSLLILASANTAVFAEASRILYVVVAADTTDPSISVQVKRDGQNIRNFLRRGFQDHPDQLQCELLYGKLSSKLLFDKLTEIGKDIRKNHKNASLLVYFTGHGEHNANGHSLIVGDESIPRTILLQRMKETQARLCLLLTNSCNNRSQGDVTKGPDEGAPAWEIVDDLFLRGHGTLDINACSVGEYALIGDEGAVFTNALIETLKRSFAQLDIDKDKILRWEEVQTATQEYATVEFKRQKINVAEPLPPSLRKQETQRIRVWSLPSRSRVGVVCADREGNVLIESVLSGSPAERAGLSIGDVILSIDGRDVVSVSQISEYLLQHKGPRSLSVRYLRPPYNYKAEQATVELEE